MVDFGNRLRILRKERGLVQSQLADQLGLTKSVISAYETDLRMPSYDILIRISKIFGVSTDYLLGVDKRKSIDMTGLTDDEVSALLNLIEAMRR